jgi:hypothetical protein
MIVESPPVKMRPISNPIATIAIPPDMDPFNGSNMFTVLELTEIATRIVNG